MFLWLKARAWDPGGWSWGPSSAEVLSPAVQSCRAAIATLRCSETGAGRGESMRCSFPLQSGTCGGAWWRQASVLRFLSCHRTCHTLAGSASPEHQFCAWLMQKPRSPWAGPVEPAVVGALRWSCTGSRCETRASLFPERNRNQSSLGVWAGEKPPRPVGRSASAHKNALPFQLGLERSSQLLPGALPPWSRSLGRGVSKRRQRGARGPHVRSGPHLVLAKYSRHRKAPGWEWGQTEGSFLTVADLLCAAG